MTGNPRNSAVDLGTPKPFNQEVCIKIIFRTLLQLKVYSLLKGLGVSDSFQVAYTEVVKTDACI